MNKYILEKYQVLIHLGTIFTGLLVGLTSPGNQLDKFYSGKNLTYQRIPIQE